MRILIIEDDPVYALKLSQTLAKACRGAKITDAQNLSVAVDALNEAIPDLIILDAFFPRKPRLNPSFMAGKFLEALKERRKQVDAERPDIILVSSDNRTADYFKQIEEWLSEGDVRDVLPKSAANMGWRVFDAILKYKVRALVEERELPPQHRSLTEFSRKLERKIYTRSEAMLNILSEIRNFATSSATVLITGEIGAGKDVIAEAIHKTSGRRGEFRSINCAAIPKELVESELFGSFPGAFDGAKDRKGYIEDTDQGTLFLDEIGEMRVDLQAKLLRVLEEKKVTRLGSTKPMKVDVRLIAATSANLEAKIQEGTFLNALFYRLKVIRIEVPPLRKRPEDTDILLEHFLDKYSKELGWEIKLTDFDEDALDRFRKFYWPGNVRQLENLIISVLARKTPKRITLDKLRIIAPELFEDAQISGDSADELTTSLETKKILPDKPTDTQELLTQLKGEISGKDCLTWKQLDKGDESVILEMLYHVFPCTLREVVDRLKMFLESREKDESVILATLFDIFPNASHGVIDKHCKVLRSRKKNDPRPYGVYKALLYLRLRPESKATIDDFQNILHPAAWDRKEPLNPDKKAAWATAEKVGEALMESLLSELGQPLVSKRGGGGKDDPIIYELKKNILSSQPFAESSIP